MSIRCPECGGLNPAEAQWCGQCLKRFAPPPAPPGREQPRPPSPADPGAGSEAVGVKRGAFEVTEEGILWSCTVCGTTNPVDQETCRACGATLADTLRPEKPERPQRDPNMAALVSLFFPGAGHAYMGLWGDAIARGVLTLLVVLVFFVFLFQGGSPLVAFVFALLAFALWALAAHDAYREAGGEPEAALLKGPRVVYAMLGVLGLLFVLLVVSFLQARS